MCDIGVARFPLWQVRRPRFDEGSFLCDEVRGAREFLRLVRSGEFVPTYQMSLFWHRFDGIGERARGRHAAAVRLRAAPRRFGERPRRGSKLNRQYEVTQTLWTEA